ncbi:ABC transporter permease [Algoriphagus chordae]|uniref:Putative ABC transport system permease protein n=1 Tax=Algoriphagus chordae TaxID=237019 RepID=A0A2W7SXT7_9BACT|nr:ABC transporter permease [Algoriphagus chordae]PZX55622.1 putative ABC transport system permease protein [Algoriphagus chordae]
MIKTYIKLAFRNLLRNKTSTAIHIAGLGVGIVSTLMILFYVNYERSYEDVHAKAENIYRISLDIYNGNEFVLNDAQTYQLIGQELKDQMPEVLDYVRMFPMEPIEFKAPSTNVKSYESRVYLADESILDIFTFELIEDQAISKFSEPFKVIISESTAEKYFGKSNVVGEMLSFPYDPTPLEVVGVMRDSPQNTHIKYDLLVSHTTLPIVQGWYKENLWNANNEYTFLLMNDGVDLADFNQKLVKYSEDNVQMESEIVLAEPMEDIHLYSNKTYEPEVNGSAQTVNFMLVIGILILVLAWINYVNLSTAKAMDRAKEVGIRKTIGSTKSQLVFQFFTEAFLTNLISGLVAILIFIVLLPYFKSFTKLDLSIAHFGEMRLFALLLGVVLFGTLVSGFYPAMVLSGFNPISVLKGKFSNTAKGVALRKGLVYVQFIASVVLLCVTMAVFKQMQFLNSQDLGVEIDNTLVVRSPQNVPDSLRQSLISAFESQALQNSWVEGLTLANSVPGSEVKDLSSSSGVRKLGEDESTGGFTYYHYGVKENYPEVMGIELLAGENLEPETPFERILISETAMENLGYATPEEAVGEIITFYRSSKPSEIQGVFKNFHQRSPKEAYMPLIIYRGNIPDNIIVKLNTSDSKMAVAGLEEIWNKVYPESSYDYYFLNDTYNAQYQQEQQFAKTVLLFTLLSILIAGLGLFGLSAYMVQLRTKEIGVRTVLGASKPSLVWILSKGFMGIVATSGLIAIPISYYFIQTWLGNYASQVTIGWQLFAIPLLFILTIAMVTVGAQTLKSAYANPVDSLKSE